MKRTSLAPTAKGELSNQETLVFSAVLCAAGLHCCTLWIRPA